MFQIAGARRSELVIGSGARRAGESRAKSRMRCSSGETPVIIVVQSSGESGGCSVSSTPRRPSRTRRWSSGIAPSAMRRSR